MPKTISRRGFFEAGGASLAALWLEFGPLGKALRAAAQNADGLEQLAREGYGLPELDMSERMGRIMAGLTPLSFDEGGDLIVHERRWLDEYGRRIPSPPELGAVHCLPTRFNSKHRGEGDKVDAVDIFVVHFDSYWRRADDGRVRTAQNTLWGLDDSREVSVPWCVDEYPIARGGAPPLTGDGHYPAYGILQTQEASGESARPFAGKHVVSGAAVARETVRLFNGLGISSNFGAAIGQPDLNRRCVAAEQIGNKFDERFPALFPLESQISNYISLSIAAAREYGLGPWDFIGHMETQEKNDPGEIFMLLERYALGLAGLLELAPSGTIFKGYPSHGEYFEQLEAYFREKSETNRELRQLAADGREREPFDYVGFSEDPEKNRRPSPHRRDWPVPV